MDYGTFVSFLTDKTTVIVSNKDDFENFVDSINVDKDVFIALLKDFVTFVEEQVGSESCIVVEPRVDKINGDSYVDIYIRRKRIGEFVRQTIQDYLMKTFPTNWLNYINVEFQED